MPEFQLAGVAGAADDSPFAAFFSGPGAAEDGDVDPVVPITP